MLTRSLSARGSIKVRALSSATSTLPKAGIRIKPSAASWHTQSQSKNSPPRNCVVSMRSTKSIVHPMKCAQRHIAQARLERLVPQALKRRHERAIEHQLEAESELEQRSEPLAEAFALTPEVELLAVQVPDQIHRFHLRRVALAEAAHH